MARRVSDLLGQRAAESFVGGRHELATLLECLHDKGPLVVQVHGLAGVGKTTLLDAFSAQARTQGAVVVRLDSGTIEPTERGLLYELGVAIGSQNQRLMADEAAERLGSLGDRVVLVLDTYELLRFLDSWLRQVFIPKLGDNVRVILSGRHPPIPAWLVAQEWQGLFRSVDLGPLAEDEALELLAGAGVSGGEAKRINRFVRGHPLALRLAASAVAERPGLVLEGAAFQGIFQRLTSLYLADVNDAITRQGLEAASVVRRATQSLLGAMLPNAAPQDVYDRLLSLPFVESGRTG